jgi:rod shape-determining protein MreD
MTLGNLPRPNLVLIVSSTWAAIRGDEGFLWAAGGGLMLDLLSGAPFGVNLAGLVLGNTVALLLDRVPIPVPMLRATNWVAVTTVVYYAVTLVVLAFVQRPFDITLAFTSVILPALIINPALAIPTYIVLSRLQSRLREQERFLPER